MPIPSKVTKRSTETLAGEETVWHTHNDVRGKLKQRCSSVVSADGVSSVYGCRNDIGLIMYHVLPCCQRPLLCCLYLGNVARDKLTNSLGVDARLARRDLHRHRQVIIPLKMQLSCSITQRRLPRFKSSSLCQLESFLTSTVLLNYSNAGCVT